MKLDFDAMPETVIPRFKGGDGEMRARMFRDGSTRIPLARLANQIVVHVPCMMTMNSRAK